MTEPSSRDRGSEIGLLVLALIWGINFSVIKRVLVELDPLAFNALRFPLAALLLYLLLRLTRGAGALDLPEREDVPRIVALGLLGHLMYQLLFIVGMDLTTAGNAALLLATTPVWTVLLSFAAGHERPPPAVWTGIAVTVAGMVLVVLGGPEPANELRRPQAPAAPRLAGDLLMLAASMSWAVYTVGGRTLVRRYGPLPVTAWTLWIATPLLVLAGLPWLGGGAVADLSGVGWAGLLYAGGLGISVAYLLWYRGVQRLGSSRTAVYSNLVPVVALAVAWLWLGEVPTPLQATGAVVVLGGLTLTRARRRTALDQRPGPTGG